ncbi:MAG: rhomboid family intramembrane serine protease [Candidatus Aenigmatarchaeota archaeon]
MRITKFMKAVFYSNLKILERNKDFLIRGLIIILTILSILIVIFFLPITFREKLVLNKFNPTIWTLYTTNFVHEDLEHLKWNLVGFATFSTLILIILSLFNSPKFFYKILLINLTVVPILLSIYWIFVETQNQYSLGFSGIVASIFGSFVFLYVDLFRTIKVNINSRYAFVWLITFVAFVFALTYFPFHNISVIMTLIISIFFYAITIKNIQILNERLNKTLVVISLTLIMPIILVFSSPFFPIDMASINRTNLYTHFGGIVFGILTTFFLKLNYNS